MKRKWTRFSLNRYTTHGIFGISVGTAVGIAGAAASAAGSLAQGSAGADAAGAAAGLQKEYLDLGINELRGALGPSMDRLNKEQAWSDMQLKRQYKGAMGETRPYQQAGAAGLGRLNYLLGTDNGLGPQPTAPTAPKQPAALKPPVYDKDPKKAAAQKAQYQQAVAAQAKQYRKDLRAYDQAKAKYATDSAAWQANTAAAASDPGFGSLMKPYEDKFASKINDVANRQYQDKYGQEILDTARSKFGLADFQADPGYEFRRSEGNRGIEQSAAAHGSLQSGAALKELNRFNQDTASNEFDRAYGRWGDQRNTKLGALTGQQAQDYRVFGDQKGTELGALENMRNFDFGNFTDNRNFQTGALQNMVGVGQSATDDRNQLREYFGGARTANRLATANQLGNWRNANAAAIAEFLAAQGNAQAAGQINSANAWGNAFQGAGNALGAGAGLYYGQNGGQRPWWQSGNTLGGPGTEKPFLTVSG